MSIAKRIARWEEMSKGTAHTDGFGKEGVSYTLTETCQLVYALRDRLRDTAAVLERAVEEMEESCENEGRLTSMKVAAADALAILARLAEEGLTGSAQEDKT